MNWNTSPRPNLLRSARPIARIALVATTLFMAAGALTRPPRGREDPPAVPREFRAAWATPILDQGIRDWPSAPGLSPDSQRAEMRAMLDGARDAGLNAVILHVRLAGDAMYPTPLAPWSAFLTGTSGVGPSPPYDPLAFAITEAHARGLQLHAWFNPFRAMLPNFANKAAPNHVTRAHPSWVRKYGTQRWMDPGEPAARAASLATILDVVKRYDVDGVHIDDYFYPYIEYTTVTRRVGKRRVHVKREIPFPDDATWKKYGKAQGFTSRAAWRRANIDDFIESIYRGVKKLKPSVLVGVSPFGIWRPGNPPGITGLDAYEEIYADSRKWLREGWLDYLVPQLYWQLGGAQDRFVALEAWWRTQNPKNRHIWPGLYTSRAYDRREAWGLAEIPAQVQAVRNARGDSDDAPGVVHFRLGALLVRNHLLGNTLATGAYASRALVPASPWLGSVAPAAPIVVTATDGQAGPQDLTVTPGDSTVVRWWLVQVRSRGGAWTTTIQRAGQGTLTAAMLGDPDEVAVSAIGATGIAGPPTVVVP
jgi:uncharacterized lipoprotein YddW (UPF0748 family)